MRKKPFYLIWVLSISAVIVILSMILKAPLKSGIENPITKKALTDTIRRQNRAVVNLYFSDKEKPFLIAENRALIFTDDPVAIGKSIINNLIKGPKEDLMRTIPVGTKLNAFYITENQTAYVDLTDTIKENHPGGVITEQLTIYSIVNSLILNIPQIDAVKILIDGSESLTLAGHVDLRFSFNANMLIVR